MNSITRRLHVALAACVLAACGGGDLDHPATLDALRAEAAHQDAPAPKARDLAAVCPPRAPSTPPSC